MSMIKRGHSDNNRPTVISITYRCPSCGNFKQGNGGSTKCENCQTQMVREGGSDESSDCPGGICRLD